MWWTVFRLGTGFKLQNTGTYQQRTSTQEITVVQTGMVWSCLVKGGPRCQETIFAATVFIRASCLSYSSPVGGDGLRYMDGLNNTIEPDWTSHRSFLKNLMRNLFEVHDVYLCKLVHAIMDLSLIFMSKSSSGSCLIDVNLLWPSLSSLQDHCFDGAGRPFGAMTHWTQLLPGPKQGADEPRSLESRRMGGRWHL